MFSVSVKSKEEIWNDVKRLIDYGTEEEQQRAIREATEQRKASVQQNEPVSGSDEGNEPKPIGTSVFSKVYDQFKGKVKEAIEFLSKLKNGVTNSVLHHKDIGDIDLAWGDSKQGLAHIMEKHPNVTNDLQTLLDDMHIVQHSDNRIVLESDTHKAVISKMKGEEVTDNWLLTAYEKKKSVSASSSDIETEPKGKRNGTATPQNGPLSIGKDNKLSGTKQEISKENVSDSEEDFKKWVDSSKRKTKPFAKYSFVKTEGDVKVQHPIESKGSNRLVTDERYAELKKRMRAKLGQLNMGVDPEVLTIGTEMAVYHIEKGTRKFVDFAKAMIEHLGDAVRPYLKAFYNGTRDMPEMEELSKDMTSYEEVRAFDVATIGKKGEEVSPTLFDTAEQINNEQTIEHNIEQEENDTKEAKDDSNIDTDNYSITKQHNNKKDVDIWVVRDKGERTRLCML